jgi:hypothetical protein
MEPFTLILWIWMGQRFEETRILNLGREECVTRQMEIEGDRERPVHAMCRGYAGYILPGDRSRVVCAHAACGWPLPGRKRV